MPYLFTPPQIIITETHPESRALCWKYAQSGTVWRINGVWYTKFTPAPEEFEGADLIFTTPDIVPDDVASELLVAGIGTCIHIT